MLWRRTETLQPYALALLRIAVAFMFLQHGLQKFGFLGGRVRVFPDITWFAAWFEVLGPPLVALGLWTKPVAFILSGEMAVAYFRSHAPRGFWPINNAGEPAYLFCFIFLYLAVAGAGAFSLDRRLARRSRR